MDLTVEQHVAPFVDGVRVAEAQLAAVDEQARAWGLQAVAGEVVTGGAKSGVAACRQNAEQRIHPERIGR